MGLVVIGLLLMALIVRIIPETTREDLAPSKNERCSTAVCIAHTEPLCSPGKQSASMILLIRSKDTEDSARVTLILTNIASGQEVERHEAQKLPRGRAYRWIVDVINGPKNATVVSQGTTFTYTMDPRKQECLTAIG